jgi:hypothetical protein
VKEAQTLRNSVREIEILSVSGESFRGEEPKGCGQAKIGFAPVEQRKDHTLLCISSHMYA